MRIVDLIRRHDARHNLALGLIASVVVFFLSRAYLRFPSAIIASWDAFAIVILALDWLTILTTPQRKIRELAQQQDLSRLLIFVFVVVAACASLFAVGFLVSINRPEMRDYVTGHLVLGLATVIVSWILIHTVFALRYAHTFYGDSKEPGETRHAGGLVFPGERVPDYFDFAYFSLVIGMTCQVSDVQTTSGRMRRLTLLQSLLAFGFNTVILALLINTVFSLLGSGVT